MKRGLSETASGDETRLLGTDIKVRMRASAQLSKLDMFTVHSCANLWMLSQLNIFITSFTCASS